MDSTIETKGFLKKLRHKPVGRCGLAKNSIGCDIRASTPTDKFDTISHCFCMRLLFILKFNMFLYNGHVFRGYPKWAAISNIFSNLPSLLQGQPSRPFAAMRNIMAGPMRRYARGVQLYCKPWAAIFWPCAFAGPVQFHCNVCISNDFV